MLIIEGKILEGSTNSYRWMESTYDGLVLNGYNQLQSIHSKDEFARGKAHVNGIEFFSHSLKEN